MEMHEINTKPSMGFAEQPDTIDDLLSWLCKNCNSYERLPALLEMAEDMGGQDWLILLGELWSGFDNIGPYRDDLFSVIREKAWNMESVIPELMSDDEHTAFDALPEQITIYRGCGAINRFGFSWSLDRKVAANFPFMARYRADKPILLTTTINKNRAAAVKLDRGEQEIILLDYSDEPSVHWTEEALLAPMS